jgi:predicted anti-sigma-YlaC factor YlaD
MSLKPTCKEVHQLTSESMDRELTLVERTRVRMHLLVCHACQNFTEQMNLIRKAMQRMVPDKDQGDDSL